MAKKLIGVDNLDAAICPASNTVYADGSIILTPGAKDALGKRGVAIVYGPKPDQVDCPAPAACPPGCTCPACTAGAQSTDPETLVLAVACILKDHYHITDPGQLPTLCRLVVRTIRENI